MIELYDVGKKFRVYKKRTDRLKEWLCLGKKKFHEDVWALKDISLKVGQGESFGLIGMNGAGKSTLLKLMTGTLSPTVGSLHIHGRVAALLELGSGFHEELTGRENVWVNGKLLGLSHEEISEKIADIAAFSELGSYFDQPVRTYSTGMYVRLGFSLASSVNPQVLIIDEALSVGDAYFQQKCLKRIRSFKEQGVTILFVSHDLGAVRLLCDRVALLQKGHLVAQGSPQEMLDLYNAALAEHDEKNRHYLLARGERDALPSGEFRSGNQKIVIKKAFLKDTKGNSVEAVQCGMAVAIHVLMEINKNVENPTFGFLIRDRLGYDIFGTNTSEMSVNTGSFSQGDQAEIVFFIPAFWVGPGEYTLTLAAHSDNTHENDCYEWVDRILNFHCLPRSNFRSIGVAYMEPEIHISSMVESL